LEMHKVQSSWLINVNNYKCLESLKALMVVSKGSSPCQMDMLW
jgi:hypothetical protein